MEGSLWVSSRSKGVVFKMSAAGFWWSRSGLGELHRNPKTKLWDEISGENCILWRCLSTYTSKPLWIYGHVMLGLNKVVCTMPLAVQTQETWSYTSIAYIIAHTLHWPKLNCGKRIQRMFSLNEFLSASSDLRWKEVVLYIYIPHP